MTLNTSALLGQFNALYTQLTAHNSAIQETTTLAEVRSLLANGADGGKATALALLDKFLALQHDDRGEFAPLASYKTKMRTLREAIAATDTPTDEVRRLVGGEHPVAQLLRGVESGDHLSDAQWANLRTVLSQEFGSSVEVAVSRGKLTIAPETPQPATKDDVFLWGDRVPLAPEATKANDELPIVFGAKSVSGAAGTSAVPLRVSVHIQNVGDREFGANEFAGTRGKSQGLEGMNVMLEQAIAGLHLEYMVHVAGKGDSSWVREGTYAGTRGQKRALEGFAMRLVGEAATQYALTYSAHVQNVGDLPTQTAGNYCGTRGRGLKVEGITVNLRKR